MSMSPKKKVKSESEARESLEDDEQFDFFFGLQMRFVLLLTFCSFLCLEQWNNFIFRTKLLFSGLVHSFLSLLHVFFHHFIYWKILFHTLLF